MYLDTAMMLQEKGLISSGDIVIFCSEQPSLAAGLFGAVGVAIATSRAQRFILTANKDEIRLFDVDKDGTYLNSYIPIVKGEIVKAKVSILLGSSNIVIQTLAETKRLAANHKNKGIAQKEELKKLRDLFKSEFMPKKA